MLDRVMHNSRLRDGRMLDIGIADGRIPAVSAGIAADYPEVEAGGRLVIQGFVGTHLHLDKACVLDRRMIGEGTVADAVRETAAAKRSFTAGDVYKSTRRGITGGDG